MSPNKLCDQKIFAIQTGVRIAMRNNPDGRLTSQDVIKFREQVREDIQFHENYEEQLRALEIKYGKERR